MIIMTISKKNHSYNSNLVSSGEFFVNDFEYKMSFTSRIVKYWLMAFMKTAIAQSILQPHGCY